MSRNEFGKRGGTSATANRKAEIIEGDFGLHGKFRKRVFFGQRFMSYSRHGENLQPLIQAWHTVERAQETTGYNHDGVFIVVEAKVIK